MSRRSSRFLSSWNSSAAEPPEAVEVESDFVVIIAALLCGLICVVGLIAVARCAWLRRSSGGGGRSSATPAAANKGLKRKIVQSLPKVIHDGTVSSNYAECAICLAEFVDGDQIRVLPQCGHGFHPTCVDTWLSSHSSCPSCRQILVVARCSKCSTISGTAGAELKAREDCSTADNGILP